MVPILKPNNPLFSIIKPRKLHNCEKIPYVVVVVWELPSSFAVLPSGQKTEWCRDHMSQWLPRMCEYAAGFTHFPHNSANFFPPSTALGEKKIAKRQRSFVWFSSSMACVFIIVLWCFYIVFLNPIPTRQGYFLSPQQYIRWQSLAGIRLISDMKTYM